MNRPWVKWVTIAASLVPLLALAVSIVVFQSGHYAQANDTSELAEKNEAESEEHKKNIAQIQKWIDKTATASEAELLAHRSLCIAGELKNPVMCGAAGVSINGDPVVIP